MPVYYGKLLELKAIKKASHKRFLQVKLMFKEDIDIYLEIDEFTSNEISTAIEGNKGYKYRLGFKNYYDSDRKQHIATLTRTYLDHSDNISFSCSEAYINILTSIKNIKDTSDLDKLSFVSRNFPSIDEKEEEKELIPNVENKINVRKLPRFATFGFTAIFIILFSYLIIFSLNEVKINREALAGSIELDNEVNIEQDQSLDLDDDIILEETFLEESNIDFVELDETITYDIPLGNVALTFDDGPSQYSMEIVNILKKHEIGGTFFFVGQNVERFADSVRYVQSNGYSIGSHSINHYNIPTLSYEDQEIELVQSIELLKEIADTEVTLFRPPYGSYSEHLKNLINENKYKMVLWNNDPKDWKTRNSDQIFHDIQNSEVSGSIILLHESQAVVDALPNIIEYLKQLDLKIVSLK